MTRFRSTALAVLFALVAGIPAAAQDFRGGIRGTVIDATGGVLPGVTVTVTNTATSVAQTVVTDDKGLFEVLYLNGGTYSVKAELSGFKTVVRAVNEVRVGDVLQLSFTMSAGGVPRPWVTADPMLNTTTGVLAVDAKIVNCRSATAPPCHPAPLTISSDLRYRVRPITTSPNRQRRQGATSSPSTARRTCRTRGVGFSPQSDAIAQFKVDQP